MHVTAPESRQAEVESFILAELARREGCTPEELRDRLLAKGEEMAYDSIVLVAVMTTVEAKFGVRLKVDLPTARDMRSVRSFAERVCEDMVDTDPALPGNRSDEDDKEE